MTVSLGLDLGDLRLLGGAPFTPTRAASAGVGRRSLERMLREGVVRRLLRGVYVDALVRENTELRAAALRLVLRPGQVVVDRTACWLHDVPLGEGTVALDVARPDPGGRVDDRVALQPRDLTEVYGVAVTTPLRTALDVGLRWPPVTAIAALDGLLRSGAVGHIALLAELPRMNGCPRAEQLRALAVQADPRSESAAESALRLHWHEARLPTAVPGLKVPTLRGEVRLALGVEHRRFGAVLAEAPVPGGVEVLERVGWRVVVLPTRRVLGDGADYLATHLEREFHQHLLTQVG